MRFFTASLGILTLAGALSSKLDAAPISLGFESGNTSGFTFSGQGNSAAIGSLGTITPLFGSFMAIVSNGPGDQSGSPDTATFLSNSFTLALSDVLTFSVMRLTAEFTGAGADPSRLDSYEIRLISVATGLFTVLHSSLVSDSAFTALAGAVSTTGGDTFFDATPWQAFSVTGLAGNYRLAFIVMDAGDNSFDSAFLIDGDTTSTSVVPEPGTTFTVGAGLACLALWIRRSRRGPASRLTKQESTN